MSYGRADRGTTATTAALAVAVAAIGLVTPGAPALAGAAPPDPVALTLAIGEQRFGVPAGQPLTFHLDFGGDVAGTAARDPGVSVVVSLHEVLTNTDELAAIDEGVIGEVVDSVATDLPAVAAAATLTVPSGLGSPVALDADLTAPAPGVYPVTVAVEADGASVSSTTFVEILDPLADPDAATTRLALLASVADPGPWAAAADAADARDGLVAAEALTAAVAGSVSLRLPPALLAPVPAPGPSDGFDGDELLAQPAIPLDPSALAPVDQSALFTSQLVAGERAAAAALPLASRSRAVWVADALVSAQGARLLRDLGVQLVIVPATVAAALGVAPGTELFPIALDSGDSLAGLVISPIGAGLAEPADGNTDAVAAARVMAAIQLRRVAAPAPTLVLATPDLGVPDAEVTAAFVRYASEVPGLSIVPASDIVGTASRALSEPAASAPVVLPADAGADLAPLAAAIEAERGDADQARSMLVDPADADAWDHDFDQLFARTIDDAEAAAHLTTIVEQIDGILGAIVAPEPFAITLTGTESDLPLTITNVADQALQVVVRVRSAKLTAEPQPPVAIPAGQAQLVTVPVTARSNGTFTIEVDLLTPGLQRIAGPVAVRGNVRRVTGLSQVVTGGAALALASWWYSHIRRNRRARRVALAGGASVAVGGGPDALSPDAAEARESNGDQRSR